MVNPYDLIPYDAEPFPDARPGYLGGLARLHGLECPSPRTARVVEIGSATGGHLIPLAWYNPDAHFTGVELSQEQVETGRTLIHALQLPNCELVCADFTQWDAAPESADYVIAHGLLSWIPPQLQAKLMQLIRRVLRPGGVAYLSYNTLPGWHSKTILRDLLHWHLRDETDPRRRLSEAQKLLAGIGPSLAPEHPLYGLIQRLDEEPGSYLAHEYLEPHNHPFHFSEFHRELAGHELRYLCDATLEIDLPTAFGSNIEELLSGQQDGADAAQYLDFLTNRGFRQSLICRADEPHTGLDPGHLSDLFLCSDLAAPRKLDLRRAKAQTFSRPGGDAYPVVHPLVKNALMQLQMAFPGALRVSELLQNADSELRKLGAASLAQQRDTALDELLGLVSRQAIDILPEPPVLRSDLALPQASDPGRLYPATATPLARQQAQQGWGHTTTIYHRTLRLDAFIRALLLLLDGTRDQQQLVAELEVGFQPGGPLHALFDTRTRPELLRKQIGANLERLVPLLLHNGLLQKPMGR